MLHPASKLLAPHSPVRQRKTSHLPSPPRPTPLTSRNSPQSSPPPRMYVEIICCILQHFTEALAVDFGSAIKAPPGPKPGSNPLITGVVRNHTADSSLVSLHNSINFWKALTQNLAYGCIRSNVSNSLFAFVSENALVSWKISFLPLRTPYLQKSLHPLSPTTNILAHLYFNRRNHFHTHLENTVFELVFIDFCLTTAHASHLQSLSLESFHPVGHLSLYHIILSHSHWFASIKISSASATYPQPLNLPFHLPHPCAQGSALDATAPPGNTAPRKQETANSLNTRLGTIGEIH